MPSKIMSARAGTRQSAPSPRVGVVRQAPLVRLHRAAGNHAVHRLLQRAISTVSKDYSRGNDDQWECCYETAAISVSLNLDDSACGKDKNAKVPATINYKASLGGKTKEADASDPTQGTTEGPEHYLEEQGVKSPKKVKLVAASAKGPDIGNSLAATLPLKNLTTCGGSSKTGCVLVKGPKSVQQDIKWSATGTTAKSLEVNQRRQAPVAGMNRIKAAIPLRDPATGYPNVKNAQPRDKNCWCDPETGYHMNYADKPKCPAKFRANEGKGLPDALNATKKRPTDAPKVCEVVKGTEKIC